MDYCKLNKVMTPTAAALTDVDLFLEQVKSCPGICYDATDLENSHFSILILRVHKKLFSFSCQGQQCSSTLLLQRCVTLSVLDQNLAHRDLYSLLFHKISH